MCWQGKEASGRPQPPSSPAQGLGRRSSADMRGHRPPGWRQSTHTCLLGRTILMQQALARCIVAASKNLPLASGRCPIIGAPVHSQQVLHIGCTPPALRVARVPSAHSHAPHQQPACHQPQAAMPGNTLAQISVGPPSPRPHVLQARRQAPSTRAASAGCPQAFPPTRCRWGGCRWGPWGGPCPT